MHPKGPRFHELDARLALETAYSSSSSSWTENDAYKEIVGWGEEALHLILARIFRFPIDCGWHHFSMLHDVSDFRVREESRGRYFQVLADIDEWSKAIRQDEFSSYGEMVMGRIVGWRVQTVELS
jgi:hypothetical protein